MLTDQLKSQQNAVYTQSLASRQYNRERTIAEIHLWDNLAGSLGIRLAIIISKGKNHRVQLFARWPLKLPFGFSQVITVYFVIQNPLPSIPKVVLNPQSILSPDSQMIKACETANIPWIRELLGSRRAHPNDRTPDNLTMFRVCQQCFPDCSLASVMTDDDL